MRTRLALVACKASHQGPWLRARGNETGVRVMKLGKGERVMMVAEQGSVQTMTEFSTEGTFPLPKFSRVRFDKLAGEECMPTFVEIVVE